MRRRLGLSIDVASGVEALHSVGILHDDIKPRNILVFQDEEQSLSTFVTRKTFGESAAKQEIRRRNMAWVDTQKLRMLRTSQPNMEGNIDTGHLEVDGDWITLKNDTLKSQAGEQLFHDFVDQMTSGEPTKRPSNTYQVLQTLRHILRLELRVIYDSNQRQERRDEEKMASMWRRFNRRSIHAYSATPTLNHQETTAIVLDYFLNEKSHTNFSRELLFLWKFGSIAKFSRQHCSPSNSSKRRVKAPITKVQFKYIADSPRQDKIRRATASFEYAVMILCFPAISEADSSLLPGALHYLHLSATLGHHEAQSMVGTFYDSFGLRTPISLEEETEQLLQASLKGSMTAMRRLRKLDPSRYIEARRLISFEYNGSYVKGEPLPETDAIITLITNDLMDVPPTFIHNLAAHGQLERLRRLSYLPVEYFDEQNGLGETPIVVACRCGHADILALLLALGADPSIGTDHGVHPLHFLSAFNDGDIPQVATTLVQHGAALEPHS
ncbi:hypothetical protein EYB26_009592 [Talaromyces marneffei]|uniref:uncharacterized protein n=1 Tax=Talaromyces marneffei TaxID=37727 RepID=UPI0012A9672F|nr:uncharacterized protein EYB26_009592 [Talaromyces marneffei]QGA21881.1 hypothetical protein EYB26_009592 [Talaromyces marneffei]